MDWLRRVELVSDIDLCPEGVQIVEALLDVEAFDRCDVALRDIGDTGEDVGEFVVELAASVIVSTVEHHGEIRPYVAVSVIDLCLAG